MSMMPDGGPITYKIILQKCQSDEPYKTEVIHLKTDKAFQKVKELATAQNALDNHNEQQLRKEYNIKDCCWDAVVKHGHTYRCLKCSTLLAQYLPIKQKLR